MDDLESRYYDFLLERGYILREAMVKGFEYYLQFFLAGQIVLDVGCGDGTFLKMLQDMNCIVAGIDIDPEMISRCRARGLKVELADAIMYLTQAVAESYDFIVASNFIEHLPALAAIEFLRAAHRTLKPGGKILIMTPNAESLIVHLYEFWRDATHQRLYNRQLLEFLLWYNDFNLIASGTSAPSAWVPSLETQLTDIAPREQTKITLGTGLPEANPDLGQPQNLTADTTVSSPNASLPQGFLKRILWKMLGLEAAILSLSLETAKARQAQEAIMTTLKSAVTALNEATVFLYPAREIYVLGQKRD